LCINDAITLWSSELPFAVNADVEVAGNEYEMPDRCVVINRIWGDFTGDGVKEFVSKASRQDTQGAWVQDSEPIVILPDFPEEGKYYLPRTPQATFTLYYGEHRAIIDAEDATLDFGMRTWGLQALRALAAYYSHNPRSTFRADLAQWAGRTDLNVGNPLAQEAKRWLQEYERIMRTYTTPLTYQE
jgi:hypothetical protein